MKFREFYNQNKTAIVALVCTAMTAAAAWLYTHPDTPWKQVITARVGVSGMETIKPVEYQDTNLVPIIQKIVDQKTPGVTVAFISSSNPNVTGDGTILYTDKEATGLIVFSVNDGNSSMDKEAEVTVPVHYVIPPLTADQQNVVDLKAAMAGVILKPAMGVDVNIVPVAQAVANTVSKGVVIDIVSSSNSHILMDGTIFYNAVAETAPVTLQYTKGTAVYTQEVKTLVPARSVPPVNTPPTTTKK